MEEISNPRRILAVSLENSTQHLSQVIKDLTGSHPSPASPSLAGSTHHLPLKTAYYSVEVPIWLDVVGSPSEWAASFLTPEAREVLAVLGGVVVVFPLSAPSSSPSPPSSSGGTAAPSTSDAAPATAAAAAAAADPRKELIAQVGRVVREGLGGWEWDGVGLGVGVGEADGGQEELEAWDECCAEWGLEFVHARGQKGEERNEFGEKVGIPRVLEALESNDWAMAGAGGDGEDDGSEFGEFADAAPSERRREGLLGKEEDIEDEDNGSELNPEDLDFGFDREDFAGLRQAIWSAGKEGVDAGGEDDEEIGEEDVRKIERMMRKLQAVRDTSSGLPEEQRKRMARQAVGEVMKEL
ncbi:Alpha and gamma adaptin binding protein p34 [Pleurostoma richardsiae]|uniref:Alpha and gamma adaptin binding protein p34 n=1 Tax=Pleurostoma richardsiae TaxID=41990 RepID=A0AA38VJT3_9PEZI|nr:Alpha and gamma adaptin binding protein p34 [Pleurostoma richardsiae]